MQDHRHILKTLYSGVFYLQFIEGFRFSETKNECKHKARKKTAKRHKKKQVQFGIILNHWYAEHWTQSKACTSFLWRVMLSDIAISAASSPPREREAIENARINRIHVLPGTWYVSVSTIRDIPCRRFGFLVGTWIGEQSCDNLFDIRYYFRYCLLYTSPSPRD